MAEEHGLDRCTVVFSGMAALYLALCACARIGRRPTGNSSSFYESEAVCACMGGSDDPDCTVLVWDFDAFNTYSMHGSAKRDIPPQIDTILLDVTLLGPTIAGHIRPLAKALALQGIDLIVWSSLSKLTQDGINTSTGGYLSCASSTPLADACDMEIELYCRHAGAYHALDLPGLKVCPDSSLTTADRWFTHLYLWSELMELGAPGLQINICPTPQFVSMRVPITSATEFTTTHHQWFVKALAPEVAMRNSFGFNEPVFNTYTSVDSGISYGTVRVSLPPLSTDNVRRLAVKINNTVSLGFARILS